MGRGKKQQGGFEGPNSDLTPVLFASQCASASFIVFMLPLKSLREGRVLRLKILWKKEFDLDFSRRRHSSPEKVRHAPLSGTPCRSDSS